MTEVAGMSQLSPGDFQDYYSGFPAFSCSRNAASIMTLMLDGNFGVFRMNEACGYLANQLDRYVLHFYFVLPFPYCFSPIAKVGPRQCSGVDIPLHEFS